MKEHKGVDLFEPRAIMEAEPTADVVAEPMHAFAFAFNDPNFSDRVLRIEIVGGVLDSSGEEVGCLSITEWARNRKRRREEVGCLSITEWARNRKRRREEVGCLSITEWARNRKRRREEMKREIELSIYCEDSASVRQPDIEDGVAFENEEEEVVAMIEESPSEGGEALTRSLSWRTDCSTVLRVKEIHISSAILAAKSPFFYKLFSNGMKESEQRDVTLRINASEEDSVMELINYMYSEKITTSSPPALLDILMAADKFEVASCMHYCSTLLRNLPMTTESALLYLELPSTVSMADAVQPLTDAAKHFLAKRYKDLSKSQEEILNLPLAGIEAILSSDDLQVASEDAVFDFVLKWARLQYPKNDELRQVLGSRLSRLIRFPNMSSRKLKKVLACSDLNPDLASKVVLDALFFKTATPHRQRMLASEDPPNKRFIERAYRYRPVKVVEFDAPHQQCVVYLDIKREECDMLFPVGRVYSQAFHLGGHGFFLSAHCNMDQQSSFHCFGLFLGMQEKGSVNVAVDYEFATRSKPTCDFGIKYRGNYTFTGGKAVGYRNLFGIPWRSFTADDSPYFINGTLHLRAELTVRQLQ